MLFVLGVIAGSLGTAAAFALFCGRRDSGLTPEQNARLDRADQILRERSAEVLASNKTGPAAVCCETAHATPTTWVVPRELPAEQSAAPLRHSVSI